jgi:hypothetical protein
MKKPTLNMMIDAAAFAGFVFLTSTGILMQYVLPPGSGRFAKVFGLDRHGWGDIHYWIAVIFFAILAIHLVLHWKWIVSVVKGRKAEDSHGWRIALALVGLVALLAIAAAPFVAPLEQTGQPGRGHMIETDEEGMIRGSQTLREVAESAGMPLETLISRLGLPENVDPNERLGPLSRSYGVSIPKVRQVVQEYKSHR